MWEVMLVPLGSAIVTAQSSSVFFSEVLMNRSPDHFHFLGILKTKSALNIIHQLNILWDSGCLNQLHCLVRVIRYYIHLPLLVQTFSPNEADLMKSQHYSQGVTESGWDRCI